MVKTSKFYLKSLIIILFVISLSYCFQSSFIASEIKDNDNLLHTSWALAGIVIDDTGNGDYTWQEAILEDWCYGSGTKNDPYVLSNILFYSPGLEVKHSTSFFVLRDCYFDGTGLKLYNATNGLIYDNEIGVGSIHGIKFYYSTNNTIRNNLIFAESGLADQGVSIDDGSYNNRIMNNTISGLNRGISFQICENNVISNNILTHNDKAIDLDITSDNIIEKNYLSFNDIGIFFHENDNNNNSISNNTLINNTNKALHISSFANENIFYGNVIENTGGQGIFIDLNANDNLFYNNTFKSNNIHAIDYSSQSKWNNSEIGNYWDNFTGLDYDDDGIGDIPHIISASPLVQDFLPIWDDGDDPTPPILNIINPSYSQFLGIKTPVYELDSKSLYIDKMWYNLNGTTMNQTITSYSGFFNSSQWSSFNSGVIDIHFYANDSLGNIGYVDVTIEKDNILPLVVIHEPIESQRFSGPPKFTINIIEENSFVIWYTLDNGVNNYTITEVDGTISQEAWNRIPEGSLTIEIYVSDAGGNIGYDAVEIIKEIPLIHGYNIMLIFPMLLIFIFGVVLLKHKKKTQ